jgi:carbamoyl-phosphate synthase large subunit
VQAVRGFHDEGVEVVGINDNPATSLTRPGIADIAVIAPIEPASVLKAYVEHGCDAIAAAFGGQAALNACVTLIDSGSIAAERLLGTSRNGIEAAENRQAFAALCELLGALTADTFSLTHADQVDRALGIVGMPCLLRTSYTLGGAGTQLLRNAAEARDAAVAALAIHGTAPTLERSLLGWCEVEFEVIRDVHGTAIAVCSMENLDPVGVHTGDSVVVAPILTLDDALVQELRRAALEIAHVIEIVGACNVQFAVDRSTRAWRTIECNPRTSRSSALASKATAYPIARIAARLMCGARLSDIRLGPTGAPAAMEPSMDYITVKVPTWSDSRFPGIDTTLSTTMRSTGESMGIGASFAEALCKAARGASVLSIRAAPAWNGWFTAQVAAIDSATRRSASLAAGDLRAAKLLGVSDAAIAAAAGVVEGAVRRLRWQHGIVPGYRTVDGTAGEVPTSANYAYSTYASAEQLRIAEGAVLVIGSGPITIGQGVEFDCCAAAALSRLRELGVPSAVLNCNPETVSTDYDSSDTLVFDPVDAEALDDVLHGAPCAVMQQLGGQTALNAALGSELLDAAQRLPAQVAGDRAAFDELCAAACVARPERDVTNAPAIVRPSHVIGGTGMHVALTDDELHSAIAAAPPGSAVERMIDGVEFDVDVITVSGGTAWTPGAVQQLDPPGVHSGDSRAVWPALDVPRAEAAERAALAAVAALGCTGVSNVQVIVDAQARAYVIEVNARAGRTAPFVSKACGTDIAAASVDALLLGRLPDAIELAKHTRWEKVPVWSRRLPRPPLGPIMTSTGELMRRYATASSSQAAGVLP